MACLFRWQWYAWPRSFGGIWMNLEEFVRGKHCSGWKKKRIKPGLRARERGYGIRTGPPKSLGQPCLRQSRYDPFNTIQLFPFWFCSILYRLLKWINMIPALTNAVAGHGHFLVCTEHFCSKDAIVTLQYSCTLIIKEIDQKAWLQNTTIQIFTIR